MVDEEFDVPAVISDSVQELSIQELASDEPEEENYEDVSPHDDVVNINWTLDIILKHFISLNRSQMKH